MSVNQVYGETFLKLCEAKEMKITEVAKKSGIAKSTLSRFVNGESSLTLDQIDAALEVIHVDLSEYDFYLNQFRHNYHELYFSKIDKAALNGDNATLREIYEKAGKAGELMLALSAKARWKGLEESEVLDVSSFIMGVEIFTFYELLILSDTISEFSPDFIRGIIQDLQNHHGELKKRSRYRKIICQIACKAASVCIKEGQSGQREAYDALNLAQSYCHEKDSYSRLIYQFTKGYYDFIYFQITNPKQGLEEMKRVIEIFKWEGSEKLAKVYQKFYDDYITSA